MAITEPQKANFRRSFFQDGLFLPTRTIVIGTNSFKDDSEITEMDFIDFVKCLHILEYERDPKADEDTNLIKIILNSIGGSVYVGLGMYDAIKGCKSPVEIRTIGQCMSAGTLILQAGDYRYAHPNTSFMIHKGTVDLGETSISDAQIENAEIERLVNVMTDIYTETMSVSRTKIESMLDRNTFMDAPTARRLGLIDGIKRRFEL
jgi:ATP-dependent Clp endopeptidase proteolytic subunit ClpP